MSFISTLAFIPNFHELYKDIFHWISIIYVKYFINVDQHYCMSLSYFIFWYCIITDFYCNELIMSSLDKLTRSLISFSQLCHKPDKNKEVLFLLAVSMQSVHYGKKTGRLWNREREHWCSTYFLQVSFLFTWALFMSWCHSSSAQFFFSPINPLEIPLQIDSEMFVNATGDFIANQIKSS